jgi:hypothetical protein
MSIAGTREAVLRRSVTMTDLERAARRFIADVDTMLARSDDYTKPIVAALALMMVGKCMNQHMVELAVSGVRDLSVPPQPPDSPRPE